MSKFHQSAEWTKLAKKHKQLSCDDCGSVKDIQSGHILPQKRFPMSRLWMINLKYLCSACNLQQGDKLQYNLQTLCLRGLYMFIKLFRIIIISLIIILISRFIYVDLNRGPVDTSISYQVYTDLIKLIGLIKPT